jgi:S1-C subfamily serine protease
MRIPQGSLVMFGLTLLSAPLSAQARPAASGAATGVTATTAAARLPGARALVSLSLTVAIVGENLVVKPIPLHELRFSPLAGGEPVTVRTGLDGTAVATLPPGSYNVASAAPVTVDGTSYRWALNVDASAGTARLELTNANATTAAAPAAAPARSRQMAPEMEIYQQARTGVFRIESGLAHGSGFLADSAGFILTNAHVVAGQTTAAAVIDSATRAPLQIVYRDNDRDVAVLRVAPELVRGRWVMPLAVGSPLVEPGERVFAIGYPLNQEQTLTSGIVSSLREGAIISDVNINHGNSGGPLLNLAGEVVAINTFGDFTNQGGPGISGSVMITRAIEPLSNARTRSTSLSAPSAESLPSIPSGRFRTQDLKAFADSVKVARYMAFDSITVGRFFVTLTTPPIFYVRQKAFEKAVGKDRKKREERAHMDEDARFSEMRDFRDWSEYVGDERAPVVTLLIEPKVGETSGSFFRRLLVTGQGGKATVRYSADLESAFIFRNGQPVALLKGGTTPVKQYVDNRWVDLKDVANYGYYVLPADAFAPDADGAPPSIVVDLADLKNPTLESCRELSREIVATVWNDFVLYHAAVGVPFVAADPRKKAEGAPDKGTVCKASRVARGAPPADTQPRTNTMPGGSPSGH